MIDAVEFLREKVRMCNENPTCNQCELYKSEIDCTGSSCKKWMEEYPEDAVAFVEKWAAKHPAKTRQSVFLEQFPNAPIYTNTHNVALDPCLVDTTLRGHCPTGRGCDICRREFWLAEVEE